MLNHLFRKRETTGGAPPDGPSGALMASHVLVKFLKRLRAMSRPHLLDLGRLSGANIEFFAQAGCKVRVEDILHPDYANDGSGAPAEAAPAAAGGEAAGTIQPLSDTGAVRPRLHSALSVPAQPEAAPIRTTATGARVGQAVPISENVRAGGRPSRRIVLPPRTFRSATLPESRGGRGPVAGGETGLPLRRHEDGSRFAPCGLPTALPYAEESFDAVVAWDIFNYYDPEAARLAAAEVCRILRPGGLLLAYFHARQVKTADAPGRYRILDERRVTCEPLANRLMRRYVYQNRDIEKMFSRARIVELYFLKSSMREMLLERRAAAETSKPMADPARPRFTIE